MAGKWLLKSESYADPRAGDERIVVFEVSPRRRLTVPVSLAQIRSAGAFRDRELVRLPRLSVMSVPGPVWSWVLEMSGSG